MKAVMLAAGIGNRLGNNRMRTTPKVLLKFGGRTLLQRHIEILQCAGIEELVLGVGFNREDIEQEIASLGAAHYVRTVFNPDFENGSILTLWVLRDALCSDGPVLLMDGDVLYDSRMMTRLITSDHSSCSLLDRVTLLDDEAVKLCIRDGKIVEFRKWLSAEFDFCGESVGFFKLSADMATSTIAQVQVHIEQGRRDEPYEEPLRDVILTSRRGTLAYEDITGLPWIEIDYAADLMRANSEILPLLQAHRPLGVGHASPAPRLN